MTRGKKFNAAEKHFMEKELKWKKQLADAERDKLTYYQKTIEQDGIINNLIGKVEQQQAWIERLLEYTELDIRDIKEACERDKTISALGKISQKFLSVSFIGGGKF